MSNLSIFHFSFPSIFLLLLLLSSCFLHLLLSHLLVHFRCAAFSTSTRRTDPRSSLRRPKRSYCRFLSRHTRTHKKVENEEEEEVEEEFSRQFDIARVSL
jgi:hypothetical protein